MGAEMLSINGFLEKTNWYGVINEGNSDIRKTVLHIICNDVIDEFVLIYFPVHNRIFKEPFKVFFFFLND